MLAHGLVRPKCMKTDSAEFVAKQTQCPDKPRGRKPSRPPAAALGFSTVGMTDEEVANKVRLIIEEANKNKEGPAKGRKRSESKAARNTYKATWEEKSRSSKAASSHMPLGDKEEESAHVVEKPSRKRKQKLRQEEVEEQEDKTKTTRKSRRKNDEDEDVVDQPVKRRKKNTDIIEKPNSNKQAKDSKGAKGKKHEEPKTSKDLTAAERKARVSRKSSAYHIAKRLAKEQGLSKEEQTKAAKEVTHHAFSIHGSSSCFGGIYALNYVWCSFCIMISQILGICEVHIVLTHDF